jgi:hypothetical protein
MKENLKLSAPVGCPSTQCEDGDDYAHSRVLCSAGTHHRLGHPARQFLLIGKPTDARLDAVDAAPGVPSSIGVSGWLFSPR